MYNYTFDFLNYTLYSMYFYILERFISSSSYVVDSCSQGHLQNLLSHFGAPITSSSLVNPLKQAHISPVNINPFKHYTQLLTEMAFKEKVMVCLLMTVTQATYLIITHMVLRQLIFCSQFVLNAQPSNKLVFGNCQLISYAIIPNSRRQLTNQMIISFFDGVLCLS